MRLDRTLADLFAYVDKRVGLKNVLIVLSADHGGPEAPGHLNSLGIPAKYVTPEKWDQAPAISALKQKFGIGKELIQAYRHPYVYLNREVIREKGLDPAVVEKAVVEELMKFDGVALAVSSTALAKAICPTLRSSSRCCATSTLGAPATSSSSLNRTASSMTLTD